MHIHILGICGTFMAGVALLAKSAGHRVTGCDSGVYPPMSTQLAAHGIELIEGYDAGQIAIHPDVFIVGNTIRRGNPLLEAILDGDKPYISGPQWLAEHVLRGRWVLAVAGTHGKTTTAAALAWLLECSGLQPGFLIGGVPQNFNVSARLGESPFFVIEADEYDTSFADKRSKFVHYHPKTLILNNLEFDHADIFADLAAIERQFSHLLRTLPSSGLIVCNRDCPSLIRVLDEGCWTPVEFFSSSPDGKQESWSVSGDDATGSLNIHHCGQIVARTNWSLIGEHNRLNALSVLLAAKHVGISVDQGVQSLSSFSGVKRRMEIRGTVGGITVYDDFAHHPTAIALTLAGLRRKLGSRARILAVFEPRSNTMKLGTMKAALPTSLAEADRVYCYANGLGWDANEALRPLGEKAEIFDQLPAMIASLTHEACNGDHILIMSNGGFGGIHQQLLDTLAARQDD